MADTDTTEPPVADNTPDTPPVTHEPSPSTPDTHNDDLRSIVQRLEETVNGLTEQVSLLTPDPSDSAPTKAPWTHRFGR